ncbi:glycosyltransferase [Cetobacterium sp. ZOR0034]|uniref:glycosyltransferase n=1 Tax=Cetobacterium sp. ZOR0034 TaxID=1339239 RepID=UPI00064570FD|nr:glycosyltransferase [Cetobacterium sp. ZOR0034]
MKNIVIRSGSLRMGGLERVLIDTLNLINRKKYKVFLIIEDDCEEENIFQEDVPKDIELYFIKPKIMIDKTHSYRIRRKRCLFSRVMYNYHMYLEHRFVLKRTIEILDEIKKRHGDIDLFIDYDWGATRYIDKLNLKNSVLWIHNSIQNLLKKESKIKRFGKRMKKYDCIINICDEMKDETEKLYPFLKGKVRRVYNPLNYEKIKNLSDDERELSDNERELIKEPYILAVSRLDTVQKDYNTLLKALKGAIEKGFNKKLYILGDGPNREEIENTVSDLKLEDRVVFLGRKKNPYIWMKRSEYFVHSSKYEGFGLVLAEAMGLGKVVVSSNCSVGPKEILEFGKSGILFEVGDFKALENIFLKLENEKKLIEKLEKKAVSRCEEFNFENVGERLENLFNGILEEER